MGSLAQAQQFFLKADLLEELLEIDHIHKAPCQLVDATIHALTLETDQCTIPLLHIDRNSEIVLILGQGLPATKEEMLQYAACFESYDIIMFDYRWAHQYGWSLAKALFRCAPVQKILLDEELVVRSVISYVQKKSYKKVVGLGVCYSNFLFAKIQADEVLAGGKGPFTHLVLDSCWYSLKSFAESIATDPYLPTSPQYGGAPALLKVLTQSCIGKYIATKLAFSLLSNPCVGDYLGLIDCPVLFIHGLEDIMVPQDQFELLWKSAIPGMRAAFLTPCPHAGSIRHSSMYTHIVEGFIKSDSVEEFLSIIVE